ncbi:hypothetical protein CR513_38622, partial [Mucuna pruriens]
MNTSMFQSIPFSAFWLRSSVVSVLISLISDMWTNVYDSGLLLGLLSVVLVLHYCKGLAHPIQLS